MSRNATAEQPFHCNLTDDLPEVPTLPETLLLMELKIREFSVDLREISRLVLGDLGATLQIYRRVAREYGDAEDRPTRIEDCISSLGLEACLRAAGAEMSSRMNCGSAVLELWAHSRDVAQICSALAEERGYPCSTEDAYQVGLLHGIGLLPRVLGWNGRDLGVQERCRTAARLAYQWSLPSCVQECFTEKQHPGERSRWDELVHLAHQKARRSPVCDPSSGGLLLNLQRRS